MTLIRTKTCEILSHLSVSFAIESHFLGLSLEADKSCFLATLVALHFTPVSHSLGQWVVFGTSVASRLASLGFPKSLQHNQYNSSNNSTRITRITILYGFTSFTSFMRFHISNKFKIFTSFAFSQGLVSSITLSPFSYFGA